jgi:hypothetical protein
MQPAAILDIRELARELDAGVLERQVAPLLDDPSVLDPVTQLRAALPPT